MLPIINYTLQELKAIFKKPWEWRIGYLLIGGFVLARWLGAFSSIELITLDFFLSHRPPEEKDDHVVIIIVENNSIQNEPTWSDAQLAELVEQIVEAEPAVIGFNIFRGEPKSSRDKLARKQLIALFQRHSNLLGVEKALPPQKVPPLPGVSDEIVQSQFGINDLPLDKDGNARRVFIGSYTDNETEDLESSEFKFSFSFRVAEEYLKGFGYTLENYPYNPEIPSFLNTQEGKYTKIPILRPTFGGYVNNSNIAPTQTIFNFRSGSNTFLMFNANDILEDRVELERLTGKAVILGVNDPFSPRYLPTSASSNSLDDIEDARLIRRQLGITGTEFEAHAASQIINGVLENRPLINSISPWIEDGLIVFAGLAGILIGSAYRDRTTTLWNATLLSSIVILLATSSYVLLWRFGIWLPIIPACSILAITGVTYIAFYQSERLVLIEKTKKLEEEAAKLLEERRKTIDRIFNSIHAGPLQTLASLLRNVKDGKSDQDYLIGNLKSLNYEIRLIGERLRQEAIEDVYLADIRKDIRLELTHPMHEVFYEVYSLCLQKELPGFRRIRVRSVAFDPFDCQSLNLETKRKLCWFLQESLENVGKHAAGTTRLTVSGKACEDSYTLRVEDNGPGLTSSHVGEGTRFFYRLEEVLEGRFLRISKPEGGTICKLTWSLIKG